MSEAVSQPLKRYTVEEYLRLEAESPEKHEYCDGHILAMAGGTESHSLISANLIIALGLKLRGTSCRVYESNLRVRVMRDVRYSYPDVMVICGRPQFDEIDRNKTTIVNPKLVVEVLSNSTEMRDRGEKFARYILLDSLEEYVLVSQREPRVEAYLRQPDGTWSFAFYSGPDAVAKIRSLSIELPMGEIYNGVEFPPEEKRVTDVI